jgi:hypothetical protein
LFANADQHEAGQVVSHKAQPKPCAIRKELGLVFAVNRRLLHPECLSHA